MVLSEKDSTGVSLSGNGITHPDSPTDEYIDIIFDEPISPQEDVPEFRTFSRRVRHESLIEYLHMKQSQAAQTITNWIHDIFSVEEPEQKQEDTAPIFISADILRNSSISHSIHTRLVECFLDENNYLQPAINTWPYKRRQREHYTPRQHFFLALQTKYQSFVQNFIEPFGDMTEDRMIQETQAFQQTRSSVRSIFARRNLV